MLDQAANNLSIPEALVLSVIGLLVVFIVLIILIIVIKPLTMIRVQDESVNQKTVKAPKETLIEIGSEKVPAPGSTGEVDLHSVDDRTAALLMAIVADEIKAPLNELRFISIKEVIQ